MIGTVEERERETHTHRQRHRERERERERGKYVLVTWLDDGDDIKFGFFVFNVISTFAGYLMPKPTFYKDSSRNPLLEA